MNAYIEVKSKLDELGITHEQADAMWESLKETNWKVQALSNSGKNWYDLTLPALKSMVAQYAGGRQSNEL